MKKSSLFAAFAAAAVVTGCQTSATMDSDMASTDRDIRVEAAGAEVDVQASSDAQSGPRVGTKFENLPAAVQDTIREHSNGAEIADIDKEERTGRMVYEVSFRDEGVNPKIHISEDGSLLSEGQTDLVVRDGAPEGRVDAQLQADSDISTEAAGAELKSDAKLESKSSEAQFQANADLSAGQAEAELQPGQEDISREAAGAELKKDAEADISIEAEAAGAENTIEAKPEVRGGAEALKEGPSANLDADVDAEVNTSSDVDVNAETEANISSEAAGAESRNASFQGTAQSSAVNMTSLPQPVQNAIKTHGGEAQINQIQRKTVYEVKFSNEQQPLLIREDGTVLDSSN